MTAAQRGTLVAGVWLIALGAVFFVQQVLALPWGRAWPLFLIMAGVGTGASAIIGLAGRRIGPLSFVAALAWPLILVAIGTLLFLDFAGLADLDALEILARWWPALLIAFGLMLLVGAVWPRGRGVSDEVSVPVDPDTLHGEVALKFGAGRLEVARGTPGVLVGGRFEGGVLRRDLGPNRVELETDAAQFFPWLGDQQHWRVELTPDLPLSLRLEGGAASHVLDLSELQVTALTIKIGAANTRVTLPRAIERGEVRIEAGAAQVNVAVPPGVAARIQSQMALGSTSIDEGRFPRVVGGWESPDFAVAERQTQIRVEGGVGSVRIG